MTVINRPAHFLGLLIACLAFGLLLQDGVTAPSSELVSAPQDKHVLKWRSSLKRCEWGSPGELLFVSVFDGFWPVPLDFVVLAPPRDEVELTPLRIDRGPASLARVYVLAKAQYVRLWSTDVQKETIEQRTLGDNLVLRKGTFRVDIPAKSTDFAVITDGETYILLWGVVADLALDMADCFQRFRLQK